MANPTFTQAELKERLHYEPLTGIFTRLAYADVQGRPNTRYAGQEAGCTWTDEAGRQYRRLNVLGYSLYGHRLAWFYMTGEWVPLVDHEDLDGVTDRWANLRSATKAQNAANCRAHKSNPTGLKGVSFDGRRRRFAAQIHCGGRNTFLGYFDTPEAAHAAYAHAAAEAFGEFSRAV